MKKILTLMLLLVATVTFAQKRNFTTLVKLNERNQSVGEVSVKISVEYDSKSDRITAIGEDGVILYDVTKITVGKTVSGFKYTQYEMHSINLPVKEKIDYQIFDDKQYGVRMYIYSCDTCADFSAYQLFED